MKTRGRLARLAYRMVSVVRGPVRAARWLGVSVGQDCRLLSKVATTEPWLIEIGDRVTVSSGVQFVTHDGAGWLVRDEAGRRFRYARIKIGSDVFIGTRATIMPGVQIGDRCVVAAGAVVTRSIPSGTVVAGVPARPVGLYSDFELKVLNWPSATDLGDGTYREQVDRVVERTMLPFMRAPG